MAQLEQKSEPHPAYLALNDQQLTKTAFDIQISMAELQQQDFRKETQLTFVEIRAGKFSRALHFKPNLGPLAPAEYAASLYRRALKLNPNSYIAQASLVLLMWFGRVEKPLNYKFFVHHHLHHYSTPQLAERAAHKFREKIYLLLKRFYGYRTVEVYTGLPPYEDVRQYIEDPFGKMDKSAELMAAMEKWESKPYLLRYTPKPFNRISTYYPEPPDLNFYHTIFDLARLLTERQVPLIDKDRQIIDAMHHYLRNHFPHLNNHFKPVGTNESVGINMLKMLMLFTEKSVNNQDIYQKAKIYEGLLFLEGRLPIPRECKQLNKFQMAALRWRACLTKPSSFQAIARTCLATLIEHKYIEAKDNENVRELLTFQPSKQLAMNAFKAAVAHN